MTIILYPACPDADTATTQPATSMQPPRNHRATTAQPPHNHSSNLTLKKMAAKSKAWHVLPKLSRLPSHGLISKHAVLSANTSWKSTEQLADRVTMAEPNIQEIHDFLINLAQKAGAVIISANPSTVDTKKNCRLRIISLKNHGHWDEFNNVEQLLTWSLKRIKRWKISSRRHFDLPIPTTRVSPHLLDLLSDGLIVPQLSR